VEALNPVWIYVSLAFTAGCVAGAVLFGAMSRGARDARKLKADLEKAEREFEAYKSGITSHFSKTAELVNEMTRDYVKVYEHLAKGAQILGEPKGGIELLEQHGKVLNSVADTSGEPGEKDDDAPDTSIESQVQSGEPARVPDPAGDGKGLASAPIGAASRDYISETIKEAADIAEKIDEKPGTTPRRILVAEEPELTPDQTEESREGQDQKLRQPAQ